MRSSHYLVTASVLAVATALSAGSAAAQTSGTDAPAMVEEVVVTGSFIAGTPEDAALPVNVIGADELQKQGSPSTVDLIKSIPAVQGAVGESNQFGAGQTTGVGSANLRGLGAERTLVLFNGRRMSTSPGSIFVDTNLLPQSAIGRVEVLKDGAAATYGSDAIGGVINFITRKNFDGLELQGGYTYVDGSDGDYNASLTYGFTNDRSSLLLSGGYRHRSELPTVERDFAVRSFAENPQGGWSSFGNPGLYLSSANGGITYTNPVVDPACNVISGPQVGTLCQFQYIGFNNLVEEEDYWQLYGEFNFDVTDTTTFHAEVLYAGHNVSAENSSPSYPPNNFPSSALTTKIQGNGYFIPANNPGLQALLATNPGQVPASAATAGLFTSVAWRPIGVDGNDLFGGGGKEDKRRFDAYRVSAGLTGEFEFGGGIGWDASMTYMDNWSSIATPDILVGRLQQALRGLGGANCTGSTPGANGCLWFNPFSSGTSGNAVDGRTNPNFVAGTANSREVLDYIFEEYAYDIRSQLYTADLVFNGQLPIDFGAGQIGWAAGTQYRWTGLERDTADFTNVAVSPCPDSSVNPGAVCPGRENGPFTFFGALPNYDLDQSVISFFGEMAVPITDSLNATLAVRYEDYGGNVGSTTNPKVALRYQATDWLAFRASAGSTFRAPPTTQISPGSTTSLAYTTAAGGYRAYDTFGNPNLEPEEAITLNLGALFDFGDFRASVDYWSFDFEGPIDNESGSDIVNALFPNGAAGANNCANPAFAPLLSRVTFTGACGATAINRVRINFVNGPDVKTSGLDFSASYRARDVVGGDMTFGADLTYVIEYQVDANTIEGVAVAEATDYVGTMDYLGYGSQPQWKGTFFAEYNRDIHNVRATLRYVDNMIDTRAGSATFATNQSGQKIDAFVTTDLAYRVFLPWDTTVSASVINMFDQDPPFARLDLSYDPFTANPYGRHFKLNVTKRF
ncbi:MAG: TonB-dependent receptor [Phenylobacterium sp.]|jgi:iron complex outermembrane receptor protein|nr:TonB-dependent receptor [Phenylobacterium sp.]